MRFSEGDNVGWEYFIKPMDGIIMGLLAKTKDIMSHLGES